MNKDDNLAGAARYYASPQEQKILIQGLVRYFSLPERSQNRNKVVKEIASYLSLFSPHWSHRAVRLWFNNNRHTYLPTLKDQQAQQNPTIYQNNNQDLQNSNKITPFSSVTTNQNINMNNNAQINMNMNIPNSFYQQQTITPPNITAEQQVTPNQQTYPIYPMNTAENMQSVPFYNSSPMTPNIPPNQQSNPPFSNQVYNNNNHFIQPYQFNAQNAIKPAIQINPPIKFNQKPTFSQPQTNNKPYISSPSQTSQISTNSPAKPIFSIQQNAHQLQTTTDKSPISKANMNFGINETDTNYNPIKSSTIPSSNNGNFTDFNKNNNNNDNSNNNQYYFQQQQQNSEQAYIPISAMLNEIRKLYQNGNQNDPRLSNLISQFEKQCMQLSNQQGSIPPEKIEPMIDYVVFKFPSPSEDANLGDNVFPLSASTNDFSDINDRSMPFGQNLGNQETAVWDQITPNNIWQQRPFIDETLTYFESCLLTDDYFAFTSLQFGSTQRTLSVKKYRSKSQSNWTTIGNSNSSNATQNSNFLNSASLNVYQLDTDSLIDSMCIEDDSAFLLSKKTVWKISLSESFPKATINLDSNDPNFAVSAGLIKSYRKNSAIVSFSNFPSLFFINQNGYISTVKTAFSGFIDISSFGIDREKILVCSSNSPTVRLISPEGNEIASFFGHLGQVMGVEPLTDNLFASRAADKTVRLWDYRSPRMVTTITTPKVSTLCITGSKNFVICGFSNRNIAVTDIRKERGKPFLGVSTQDYNAIMMKYNADDDSLMMFGQVEKDTTKDSMIFVDTNGHSRQSILRQYSHFTGVDCR